LMPLHLRFAYSMLVKFSIWFHLNNLFFFLLL
jgi:hypothetical protein